MSVEENKAIVRRLLEEGWNTWNLDILLESHAPDFVNHIRLPEDPAGHEGLRQTYAEWRRGFPDWFIMLDAMIAEGDDVVTRLTARGTHSGEFMGIAPTGKRVIVTAIEIFRVVNGKVTAFWANMDEVNLLQTIGAIAPPTARVYRISTE